MKVLWEAKEVGGHCQGNLPGNQRIVTSSPTSDLWNGRGIGGLTSVFSGQWVSHWSLSNGGSIKAQVEWTLENFLVKHVKICGKWFSWTGHGSYAFSPYLALYISFIWLFFNTILCNKSMIYQVIVFYWILWVILANWSNLWNLWFIPLNYTSCHPKGRGWSMDCGHPAQACWTAQKVEGALQGAGGGINPLCLLLLLSVLIRNKKITNSPPEETNEVKDVIKSPWLTLPLVRTPKNENWPFRKGHWNFDRGCTGFVDGFG